MSHEACAYAKKLITAPNGERVTVHEKLLLMILADYHNTYRRAAWPSVETLAEECLTEHRQIRRLFASLEEKAVIERVLPETPGRGRFTEYRFVEIDVIEGKKGGSNVPFPGSDRGQDRGYDRGHGSHASDGEQTNSVGNKNLEHRTLKEELPEENQNQPQDQPQQQPHGSGIDIEKRRAEIAEKERLRAVKAFKKKHPTWRLPAELRPPDEDTAYQSPARSQSKAEPGRRESAVEARARRNREAIESAFDPVDAVGRCVYRYSVSMSSDLIPDTAAVWAEFLADKDADIVERAFKVCVKRSDKFFPKPNEVLAEVERIEEAEKPEESASDFFARQERERKARRRQQ